jgi:hypothetical protein
MLPKIQWKFFFFWRKALRTQIIAKTLAKTKILAKIFAKTKTFCEIFRKNKKTNFFAEEDDFIIKQGEALANMDKWIRDLAYMKRVQNFSVISPKDLLSKGCKTMKDVKVLHSLWKTADTVHLRPAGYERMAEAILDDLDNIEYVRPPVETVEVTPSSSTSSVRGSVRSKAEADRRLLWVSKSDNCSPAAGCEL